MLRHTKVVQVAKSSCSVALDKSNVGSVNVVLINLLLGLLCGDQLKNGWNTDYAAVGIRLSPQFVSPLYNAKGY
jgi:hypothetical protein